MKNKMLTLAVSTISFILIFSTISYSQAKSNITINGKDHPSLVPGKTTNIPVQNVSPEVTTLLQQQRQAKLSGDNNAVLNLQRQLDVLTGDGYTTANLVSAGTGHFLDPGNDSIVNNIIFTPPAGLLLKAFAFATEQRGANAGRIWAVFAWGVETFMYPDTIAVYYSDNGGLTWSGNSIWAPGGFSKVNTDEMDMEIMEYNTGNKYVWMTIGLKDNLGQEYAAILIIQTPTPAGGFYSLTWPGGANNTNVYRPKITSDNANYPTSQSWNFIIASRDTLGTIGEKFVKCTNPFTISPTLTYKASAYCIDKYYGTGIHLSTYDIGCFQNGGIDSIIVVESDVPDTSIIYACKSGLSPEVNGAYNFASLDGGVTTSNWKRYVHVVCNGNKNIMIGYRSNFQNIGDWDIRYAYSTNGGINASSWYNGYIDSTRSITAFPYYTLDLAGLRGTNSYKCSYNIVAPNTDSVMLASAPNGIWSTPQRVSFIPIHVTHLPRAGYRFVNGDSCIVLWSNAQNVWSMTGCSNPQTYSVSGTVLYSDNNQPVTSGIVKAIRYDTLLNKVTFIDSGLIQSNGAYIINNLPPVEMDFMAYEDDELDYAPTYYDTTIYWQHAITLIPTTNLNNIDIKVKRINNSGDGIRHISGTITTNNDLVGLADAVVYAKVGSLFKNYDISRANGYFYVDSLQDGSYTLVVDRMGYLPYTINVNLSGSSIENLNINMIYVIGISNINKEIPLQYSLSQNYPNPFNPVTNILFDIIKQENVKLTIFSLLGEEIKVLVNEKLEAGEYKVSFDASEFASGVYFYKLETENFVESKKMVLLK